MTEKEKTAKLRELDMEILTRADLSIHDNFCDRRCSTCPFNFDVEESPAECANWLQENIPKEIKRRKDTMRIVVRLEKWEKAVVMQILEQEGVPKSFIFTCNNGMRMESQCHISLTENRVFLRGSTVSEDNAVAHRHFESNEARDDYYNKVCVLFQAFIDRNKEPVEDKGDNIFVLN